jgi:hypothetical protein
MIDFGGRRLAFVLGLAAFALGTPEPARAQTAGFYKTFCYGSGARGNVGFDCPCDNTVPNGTAAGCANSTGHGAALDPTGNASISQDSLVLTASGTPAGTHGYFFVGQAQRMSSSVFGDGVLCINGPFVRLSKVAHSASQDSIPVPNTPPLSQQLNATAGDTMFFQFIYRDHGGPCGSGANASNAVLVIWGT